MLKTLSKKQIKDSKIELEIIRSSITLVLSLIFRMSSVSQDGGEVDQQVTLMKTVVETMHEFLRVWIKRVVGSVFGGAPSRWKTISSRLNKETKVCYNYLLLSHN